MPDREFLSRAEVADLWGVSGATVSRWARQGALPSVRTAGGHRRYPREEVGRLRSRLFGQHDRRLSPSRQLHGLLEDGRFDGTQEDSLVEMRLHGRAGQGLITAGALLAEAALEDGKYFQAFPEFGPERSGAPMEAFIRVSPQPIFIHSPVVRPTVLMVFDSSLLDQGQAFRGAEEGALAVVNRAGSPAALRRSIKMPTKLELVTVDATGIAMDLLKRAFVNVPMLGALLKASPVVPPDLMAGVISRGLAKRLSAPMVEANVSAFWEGYRQAWNGKEPA